MVYIGSIEALIEVCRAITMSRSRGLFPPSQFFQCELAVLVGIQFLEMPGIECIEFFSGDHAIAIGIQFLERHLVHLPMKLAVHVLIAMPTCGVNQIDAQCKTGNSGNANNGLFMN